MACIWGGWCACTLTASGACTHPGTKHADGTTERLSGTQAHSTLLNLAGYTGAGLEDWLHRHSTVPTRLAESRWPTREISSSSDCPGAAGRCTGRPSRGVLAAELPRNRSCPPRCRAATPEARLLEHCAARRAEPVAHAKVAHYGAVSPSGVREARRGGVAAPRGCLVRSRGSPAARGRVGRRFPC